jgi:hypothetical protein
MTNEKKLKKFNTKYIAIIGGIAITIIIIVTLMFSLDPFSNSNNSNTNSNNSNNDASSTNLVLSGLYVGPDGRSMQFIDKNNIKMSTVYTGGVHSIFDATYELEGNQLIVYSYTLVMGESGEFNQKPHVVGYGTVSDNAQEIVFCGDVYIKG